MQVKKVTITTEHGATDWSKIGKEVHEDYILHPAYLTSMQSTSCEMLGWMNHRHQDCWEKYQISSDMQMIPP